MTKKELETFKNLLLSMRKELSGQIDHVKENEMSTTTKESTGDHSSYSFHMADQGTDNMEREKSFFYAQRDNHTLQDVNDALDRIEEGIYGQCIECQTEINHERLNVVPYAMLCIQCQSNAEKFSRMNPFSAGEEI